jgi:hypothetical protein
MGLYQVPAEDDFESQENACDTVVRKPSAVPRVGTLVPIEPMQVSNREIRYFSKYLRSDHMIEVRCHPRGNVLNIKEDTFKKRVTFNESSFTVRYRPNAREFPSIVTEVFVQVRRVETLGDVKFVSAWISDEEVVLKLSRGLEVEPLIKTKDMA